MEWFKEELRICREFAPPDSVTCQFYITAAKRMTTGQLVSAKTPTRPVSLYFHEKVNDAFSLRQSARRELAELVGLRQQVLDLLGGGEPLPVSKGELKAEKTKTEEALVLVHGAASTVPERLHDELDKTFASLETAHPGHLLSTMATQLRVRGGEGEGEGNEGEAGDGT